MSSLATRARFAAALLAALPLLAGAARADQVTINLNGKVSVLFHGTNINAELELAAHGVSAGTPAALKLVLESTTPGVLVTSPYNYMQYDMAIVDVVLTAGTWEAHFAPPAGQESTNHVQVADNADYAGFKSDSWDGTALGVDTDNILSQGSTPAPYGTFLLHFSNSPPVPATGDALVEDLKQYKYASTCRFFGAGGTLTVDFTVAPAGDEAALARQGQLKAAANFGGSVLRGIAKFTAAAPDKDPFGTAETALLQKASDTFGSQFIKAIDKAQKQGGSAPLGASGKQAATDFLMAGLQTQSDAITTGLDTSNAIDRVLRGKLLKALAAECHSDFIAHSKDVKAPNLTKLTNALEKSNAKLIKTVSAAIDKAGKQGFIYFGPDGIAIAAQLKPFVNSFVDLTSTGF